MNHPIAAVYESCPIEEFQGNPLIEALPKMLEPCEMIEKILIRPPYSEDDRAKSLSVRLHLTQRLLRVHQPFDYEVDAFKRVDSCIRWGYTDRNPLTPEYRAQICRGYSSSKSDNSLNYGGYHPHTYGFSILGISGIGKSTSIENILSQYPQVIRHEEYCGIPLIMDQVTWLKLDCACDGSLKGLCTAFFKTMDTLIGTEYERQYTAKKITLDGMMVAMSRVATVHNLGLLVIDEIQNLCSAKSGVPETVFNFLVTLVNTIGIPVVMIGTPKALTLLQKEFQQAKRGCGQGDALWDRMQNDTSWDIFCRSLWSYQYTRNVVPYSDEMKNALYEETQGIPFLAVHLYKLVQETAMLEDTEIFSARDFKRVAKEKMKLTEPMRKAIKNGKDVDLRQFVDITPFSAIDYRDNYSISAEANAPIEKPVQKKSAQEEATMTLMGMGLSYKEANNLVSCVLADEKMTLPSTVLASKAFIRYMNSSSVAAVPQSTPLTGIHSYEEAKEARMIESYGN